MIGTTIGHYRIEAELGAGAMGVVYRAEDLRLQRPVAIKFLSAALRAEPEARARFLQEARSASALDHPNICAIHAIDETPDGHTYIVMAYYEGETLDRRIAATGPFAAGEAAGVVLQLAEGLARAHSRGIVHRDIKPSNLMLTRDGAVKILDFGLAKAASSVGLTQTGTSLGTPSHMSPEQVRGDTVDHRTDLWSAGVVLAELVTGRPPFRGDQAAALMYAILNLEPEPLAGGSAPLPAGLQEIVTRCLQKDPAARYPDAAALTADLRALLGGIYGEAPGAGSGAPIPVAARTALAGARREPRRARRLDARSVGITVAALAVAGVAAVIGVRAFGGARAPLRVGVLPAEVTAFRDTAEKELAAANAQAALLRGLGALSRVAAVDPAELRGVTGATPELARALSADDVIGVSLAGIGDEWNVGLRRLAGRDGRVVWAESFAVPRDNPLMLSDALMLHLRQGFPERSPRRNAFAMRVEPADYEEYLRLNRGFRAAGAANIAEPEMLARLDALLARSPRFLDAWIFEAAYALYRFAITRDAALLARAEQAAERARALAPGEPRVLSAGFNVAIQRGDLGRAATLLAELRRAQPGDVEVLVQESTLAERLGDADHALALMTTVIERRPSRYYLKLIADLEYRIGRIAEARRHLEQLRARYPEDLFPRSKLAQLELLYGSPARADTFYRDVIERAPGNTTYRVNRGLALMLLGRFPDAAACLRAALELAPDNNETLLNLADCEALQGNTAAATALYRRALALIDKDPTASGWSSQLLRAQCLAHLGRTGDAVAAAQEALRQAPDNSEALFTASLVYTLVGDRASAQVSAQKAIAKGVQVRWFGLPWFDPLRSDPEFRRLLAAREGAA